MESYNILVFQQGLIFPLIASSVIGRKSNVEVNRVENDLIKANIKKLFERKKSIYISELVNKLGVSPSRIKSAVNELIEEGFLKG
jgi:predicted transcriptional regulator